MTDRGKIFCNDCDEPAVWWDEPPRKSATSCNYWCQTHKAELENGWNRLMFKQDLVTLSDGAKVWYPSFWYKEEWHGWPLLPEEKWDKLLFNWKFWK